ncbi:MAG TPA: hypothetical protein VK157_05865 [Phycisphaerales bacterium]|nr:hypothetical protein [Phycisphaerales bacterium]
MRAVAITTSLVLASAAFAQAEVEPNDTTATANNAFGASGTGLVPGDTITGVTTGTSTTVAGLGSSDNFRVKTAAAPLAIYRHRLVLTTDGTAGHAGSLRGVGNTGSGDASAQSSSTTTSPARFNQWYGFGRQEEIVYRVTGGSATTGTYTATYSRDTVTPVVVPGAFNPGNITVSTIGVTASIDTDFWVYDSNLLPVATFGNDDNTVAGGGPGTSLLSIATRSLPAGRYYVAIGRYNIQNNQLSPSDERFADPVLDVADVLVAGTSTSTSVSFDVTISDGTTSVPTPVTVSGPFEAVWIQFDVAGTVGCDDIDFNNNTVFPEDQDVIDFFNVLAGADCPTCNDIDFNNNNVFPEDQDVIDFFNVLAGGTC